MQYKEAQSQILLRLDRELSADLLYHSKSHTLDVIDATERIAKAENIVADEFIWLLTAAAFHDCGFLEVYQGHEAVSCRIANEMLPNFGYKEKDLNMVTSLIMATKVPTQPQNHLEEALCDADSDYLGRPDFEQIGTRLYQEFLDQKIVSDVESWNRLQVTFLQNHQYYTSFGKIQREPVKQKHLNSLIKTVEGYSK